MSDDKQSFNFTFFSKEEIDKKFNAILEQCSSLTSNEEIIKIIDAVFYNRILLMINFNHESPNLYVYRVTKVYEGFNSSATDCFSYPPDPKLGRANLKSVPVFYCSFDQTTALREMKDALKEDETLYLSRWCINFSEEVYMHTVMLNSITENKKIFAADLIKNQLEQTDKMMSNSPEGARHGLKHLLLRIGDLFTLQNEEYYNITSAYAHDTLYGSRKKGANISMIMYPSVVSGHNGVNFAIHPDFVNSSMMHLDQIFKLKANKINDDNINVSISEKGLIATDGTIEWKRPTISIKQIEFDKIQIWTHDKNTFKGEVALNMTINNSSKTVKDYIKEELSKVNLLDAVKEIPFTDDVFEFTSAERLYNLILELDHGCKIETNSLTNEGCNCIAFMQVPISWIDDYR